MCGAKSLSLARGTSRGFPLQRAFANPAKARWIIFWNGRMMSRAVFIWTSAATKKNLKN